MKPYFPTLALLCLGCGVGLAKITPEQAKTLPPPAQRKVDFAKEIKPIFESSCIKCHGRGRTKGDLSIESRETLLKGGETGPAIIPGKSEESRLIELVSGALPGRGLAQKRETPTAGADRLFCAAACQRRARGPGIRFRGAAAA